MNKFSLYSSSFQANDWYEVFTYPAGELQVRIKPDLLPAVRAAVNKTIIARLYTPADFMELAHLFDALYNECTEEWANLILPYLPYSRADRRFTEGDCHGLLTMYRLLEALPGLRKVVTLDRHSDKVPKGWLISHAPYTYVNAAIMHTAVRYDADMVQILFPDKGARDRYAMPSSMGNNGNLILTPTYFCDKRRDTVTGKLLGFDVPSLQPGKPILIVDDICDGGGTFIGIAKELRKQGGHQFSLYTTHSMYSRGTSVLSEAGFEYLYTTNSFYTKNAATPDKMVIYNCLPELLTAAMQ